MIRLPEIKTAELSTYGNFAKCHQAHFRVSRVGLGTRLHQLGEAIIISGYSHGYSRYMYNCDHSLVHDHGMISSLPSTAKMALNYTLPERVWGGGKQLRVSLQKCLQAVHLLREYRYFFRQVSADQL